MPMPDNRAPVTRVPSAARSPNCSCGELMLEASASVGRRGVQSELGDGIVGTHSLVVGQDLSEHAGAGEQRSGRGADGP